MLTKLNKFSAAVRHDLSDQPLQLYVGWGVGKEAKEISMLVSTDLEGNVHRLELAGALRNIAMGIEQA